MVIFLMGEVAFLRDEIIINIMFNNSNIMERSLTLKSVFHDKQLSSDNSEQIKNINKNFVDTNVDTEDVPVDYQPLTRNNNMDILINKLNK